MESSRNQITSGFGDKNGTMEKLLRCVCLSTAAVFPGRKDEHASYTVSEPSQTFKTPATVSSLMFTQSAFRSLSSREKKKRKRSLSSRTGLAAAGNAILKEKSSTVNSQVES